MSLSVLINRPCVLVLRNSSATTDDDGNKLKVPTRVDSVCEIQQRRRDEPGLAGEFSVAEWFGVFPAGTALDTGDAVEVDGLGTFELVGAPWPARNPRTQAESHVEVTLKRTASAGDVS